MKISEIKSGTKFEGFLLLKSVTEGTTSKNSPFLKLVLADNESEIESMIWEKTKADLEAEEGDIVKVIGEGKSYQEKINMIISPISYKDGMIIPVRKVQPSDNFDVSEIIKAASEDPQIMYSFIKDTVSFFKDEDYKKFLLAVLADFEKDFLYCPGGEKVHHSYRSGLIFHVYRMLKSAIAISDNYDLNKDLLYTGVIIHDIGKILTFNYKKDTGVIESYTNEGVLNGHMIEGIKVLQRYDLEEEKKLLLEHMIASHHYSEQWGAFTAPAFKEAELLHHLDMIDSRLSVMEDESNKLTEENKISSRIWSLEKRKIYKVD